jgi:hypothetical protein
MKRNILGLAMALFGLVPMSTTAGATVLLILNDGINPIIAIADGDALDVNPAIGAVTFVGPLGVWTLNVSTGLGYPALGSATQPHMDLNSVDVSSGAGHLTIALLQDGYSPSPGGFVLGIGGTTNGTVSAVGCADFISCGVLGPFGSGAFSGTTGFAFADPGAPYTLAIFVDIDHKTAGASSFNADLAGVPEPGTYALMGLGLAALAFVKRRRA